MAFSAEEKKDAINTDNPVETNMEKQSLTGHDY